MQLNKNKCFNNPDFWQITIAFLFSLVLIIVNFIRIIKIPVTFDETGFDDNITYTDIIENKFGSASNHILHSLISKFFFEIFGDNLFILRLDSLIAQCLFLLFSFLLCRLLYKNIWWQLCSFIILNVTSPLIFDFWGLSRGYALGLTFMTMSIYYLFRYISTERLSLLSFSLFLGILSTYSNFSYLNYYLGLSGVIIILVLICSRKKINSTIIKELSILVVANCLLAILIYNPLHIEIKNNELYFGGHTGFISDTITSLATDGLFLRIPDYNVVVTFIIWSVVIITWLGGAYILFLLILSVKNKEIIKETKNIYYISFYLLLIIPALSIITQHVLLNVNYLIERTALLFVVLFLLYFTYLLDYLKCVIPKIGWAALIALLLVTVYHFSTIVNLNSTHDWWYGRFDNNILKRITEESKNKKGKIKVHAYWIFRPTFNYDVQHNYKNLFAPINDDQIILGKDTTYDYYFVSSGENLDSLAPNYLCDTNYEVLGAKLYRFVGRGSPIKASLP